MTQFVPRSKHSALSYVMTNLIQIALFYNTIIMILYMFRALYTHHKEVELYWCSIWYRHSESEWSLWALYAHHQVVELYWCSIWYRHSESKWVVSSSIICSSSGGWIVLMQHLVSSLWKWVVSWSIICSSSGGWIVLMQHLVSSLWK